MKKDYPPIGNVGLNVPHWVNKGEAAFIEYFTAKDEKGNLKVKAYESSFARRNDAQRVELLKGHFAIMQAEYNARNPEITKAAALSNKQGNGGK